MNVRMIARSLVAGMLAAPALAQGPLTPPGAPAPTMKTMEQVEPRTAITNVPFAISQSGSYYLATNLTSAGSGVVISASGVTLDLMGFSITGAGGAADCGVQIAGAAGAPLLDVVVRNGTLRNFQYGVRADFAFLSRLENLAVLSNLYYGVWLNALGGSCGGNSIARCSVVGNGHAGAGYPGIYLYGSGGRCNGNRIVACSIQDNKQEGIAFNASSSGQCDGNVVSDCAIVGNGGAGVEIDGTGGQCNGNVVSHCSVVANGAYGISALGTSGACSGNLISGCTVNGNVDFGIVLSGAGGACAGNAVAGCSVGENAGTGIRLNVASGNRIENNRIYDFAGGTRYGIDCVASTNNLIVRNSCGWQDHDFSMSAKDVYGPVVAAVGELATNGVSAHPWANFSQ